MPLITSRRRPKPENLASLIYLLRGEKALLSEHLAELYAVPVKVLNQAVKRNIDRLPDDFMFQLTSDETDAIFHSRSQIVTLTRGQNIKHPHRTRCAHRRSQYDPRTTSARRCTDRARMDTEQERSR